MKYFIVLLLFLVTLYFAFANANSLHNVSITNPDRTMVETELPLRVVDAQRGSYRISASVKRLPFGSSEIRLFSENCIRGVATKAQIDTILRCNKRLGTPLYISTLSSGDTITFEILNTHDRVQFRYESFFVKWIRYPALLVAIVLFLFFVFHLALRIGCSRSAAFLLVLGVVVRLCYVSYTEFNERMHDVLDRGGHLDYIEYIANQGALPLPSDGWEFHQPPLYYGLAASVFLTAKTIQWSSPYLALQLLSLVFMTGFLTYGIRTIELFSPSGHFRLAATALFVLWPGSIIHSVRLGNDQLFYFIFAVAFYYLCQWWRNDRRSLPTAAIIATTAAFFVKLNAVIIATILVGCLVIQAFHAQSFKRGIRLVVVSVLACAFALLLSLARNTHHRALEHPEESIVQSFLFSFGAEHGKNPNLSVGNELRNYTTFDLPLFLDETTGTTWSDASGRQYFLNFLVKTSLLGEFFHEGVWIDTIVQVLNWATVALLLIVVFSFAFEARSLQSLPLVLSVFVCVTFLATFRFLDPYAPNGDFRYVLPISIALAAIVSRVSNRVLSSAPKLVQQLYFAPVIVLCAASVAFIVARL